MLTEFKKFAMRGNVMDMAVGIIIGSAFSKIISSLVNDIIMPPLGLLLGKVDFSNLALTLHQKTATTAAVTVRYGLFINSIVDFLIVAFAMFLLVKQINKLLGGPSQPTTKDCAYCYSTISVKAIRCPNCTSQLSENV